jgi:4-hydroxy-tetrahydrodipicolinate synthase
MVAFAAEVEGAGLDALLVYSLDLGQGNKPCPAELERYLDDVLGSVGIPAVISTHHFAGYLVPIDVLERVADRHANVVGINCSGPSLPYLSDLIDALGERLEIHVGGPSQALAALALGGTGYLCSEANLAPRLCKSVTDHYNRGDYAAAHAAYAKVIRLYAANRYGSIRGVKAALQLLGLPGGYPRLPRLPLTDEQRDEVRRALDELRIEELS